MDVHMVLGDRGLIGTVGLSKEYFITFIGITIHPSQKEGNWKFCLM